MARERYAIFLQTCRLGIHSHKRPRVFDFSARSCAIERTVKATPMRSAATPTVAKRTCEMKIRECNERSICANGSRTTAVSVKRMNTSGYTKNDAACTRYIASNTNSTAKTLQARNDAASGKFVSGGCFVIVQLVPIQIVCETEPAIMAKSPARCRRRST